MHHLYGDVERTGMLATWSGTYWEGYGTYPGTAWRRQEVDRKLFFPVFSRESVITVGFSISKLVELHIPIHEKN
jgi:hypothetical protein